jgi:hypothetical protein
VKKLTLIDLTVETFQVEEPKESVRGTVIAAAQTPDYSCHMMTCDGTECCSQRCREISSFTDNVYCCG